MLETNREAVEFADRDLAVLIDGVGELTLSDLLPHPFELQSGAASPAHE